MKATSSGTISITITGVQTASTNNAQINGIEISANAGGPTPTPTPIPPPASADVPQYHNDTLRTGWNSSEKILNTTNVSTTRFHLLNTLNVDGLVLAQPLYISNYPVAADGGRHHNLLIIATENNSVYAFDADSLSQLWHVSLGTAQASNDVGCADIEPSYGINSTPAIDRASGTIYVVAAIEPSSRVYQTYLHALDLGSGTEKQRAVQIAASALMSNGKTTIAFDPALNMQRASILLANNSLYLGFGSHCDHSANAVAGWLMRYSTSLTQLAAFNTIEDPVYGGHELGGIWGAGFGPAADRQGNVYAVTGNGAFDASASGHNYAMSVLRFRSDLSGGVADWFSYANESYDSGKDKDLGSAGVMLLPPQSTGNPSTQNTLVAMGKAANIYRLNQGSLGKFGGALSTTNISPIYGHGTWGGPAFFGGPAGPMIYYQADRSYMHAYSANADGTLTNVATGNQVSTYGGSTPVVSSNGQTPGTGIVWTLRRIGYKTANSSTTLDAYNASNLSLLFAANAGTWSHNSDNDFVTPLVANGKVYAGAYKTVTVFGLGP